MPLGDASDGGGTCRWKRPATLVAVPLLAAALLLGCGGTDDQPSDRPDADTPSANSTTSESDGKAPVATISGAEHVHGLGVNPADGEILIATHNGLWQVPQDTTEAERVGDSLDDFMGFTIVGPDSFLSSGHPGPDSDLPPLLGLQRSIDGGSTWQSVSLLGEADLHVLKASGERVYGVDSSTGAFLASADAGESWQPRNVPGQVVDLAIAPDDPLRLVASTDRGIYGSENGGDSWKLFARDRIGLLTWPSPGRLLMVDGSGQVAASTNGGKTFSGAGSIGSAPEAFSAGNGRILAAVDGGRVLVSDDGGRTWTTAVKPQN